MSELDKLRSEIDAVDDKLLVLLNERAQKSLAVKKLSGATAPLRRGREAEIIRRVVGANQGPFDDQAVQNIFETIVYNGRNLQAALRVGYLGPVGTYSEQAAEEMFGVGSELVAKRSLPEVERALDKDVVDVAVLPLENSTEGGVSATHKILLTTKLPIIAEHSLKIQHALLSKAKTIAQVTTVYGHPQALGQCRDWLASHLPEAKLVACASNATGLERAMSDAKGAAIASAHNAVSAELHVLEQAINDEPDNTTRFIALAHDAVPPTGDDKTSLFCTVNERSGALYELLGVFNEHDISLTRLESQPYDGGYGFFMDFAGHQDEPAIAQALTELRHKAEELKVLGSYPQELA